MRRKLLEDPDSKYFSRELSWLAFNERVLDEAADTTNPLLERMKFLAIVSNNLEEFFMIRVAGLFRLRKEALERGEEPKLRDGFTIDHLLERIRLWVFSQKMRQAQLFEDIRRDLTAAGLHIESGASPLAQQIFEERVLPHIAPIRIPDEMPITHIRGSKLYLLARHSKSRSLIEIPPAVPRLFIVKTKHVFLTERLIDTYRDIVFKNQDVHELFAFKVSKDAEIEIDEEADDPLLELEEQIATRDFGPIVRMEIDSLNLSESVRWLQNQLKAPAETLYQLALPLDLRAFLTLHNLRAFKKLKYSYPEPKRPPSLPAGLAPAQFFRSLEKHDILLHHPYQSFDPVVELVQNAARDPATKHIYQTLYRTSGKSPILEALMNAAHAGKQVTALIEVKARFDEANNIRWGRALEKAGARVLYNTDEHKVHAKLTYVERKVGKNIKSYLHVSTGNYHPRTAKLYTDLALMTTDPQAATDAKRLFECINESEKTEQLSLNGFKSWVVAPNDLHPKIIEWIENEKKNAQQGKPAGIRAKMNGLVEHKVIDALYAASQAGVKIDLIVRGMCCLRPGVPGLSENIRVRSIVDKYLEHSRLFIFENGGERKLWLSSADWMPRNFFRRIELAVPIRNSKMIEFLADKVWSYYDLENVRAQQCDINGVYHRVPLQGEAFRSQFAFEVLDVPEF
ncbi:MAG: polyphosphate kinase 1 [Bdellovibrionales bacterium]|nr:polyphosphate kinase 1 [Bdellovibrionales bacterium]